MELIRSVVRDSEDSQITVYAQEKSFSDLEEAFLDFFNVKILSDPEAQRKVKQGVFSFAPFWGADLELVGQCEHRQPSLHFGCGAGDLLDRETLLFQRCSA